METRSDYRYEAYDTLLVRQIRIPQQEWAARCYTSGCKWTTRSAGCGALVRELVQSIVICRRVEEVASGYSHHVAKSL